jgi:predicted RNA binding protein YcfA (HicA-like mRNA interferase family)
LSKSGRKLPTLTAADLICVIEADGWVRVDGTKHLAWEHPRKEGKVNIGANWKHIRPSGWPLTSVLAQAGLTKDEFEALYWVHCR